MDSHTLLRAFNDHFEEFMDDVLRVFPGDAECIRARAALRAMRKANPSLIIRAFGERVCKPYRSQIRAGELAFFVDKDYRADVQAASFASPALSKIEALRAPIRAMGEADKKAVIKYMQNLLRLVDMYQESKKVKHEASLPQK